MQLHSSLRQLNKVGSVKLIITIMAVGIVVLVASFVAWGMHIRNNPNKVFMGMIENNFRTPSVTRTSIQGAGTQTIEQHVRLLGSPKHIARGVTTLEQTGQGAARAVTETIGTPSADYVQYTEIETNQVNTKGEAINYDSVLNVWGVLEQPASANTSGELYSEMMLGALPFANASHEERETLMRIVRDENVYAMRGNPRKVSENGRSQYVYDVSVRPEGYVKLLKELGNIVGLSQLANLDPATYADADPFEVTLTVDVWSQRITRMEYSDGRVETYGGYGVRQNIEVPKETIPLQELQTRIQDLQN